MIKEILIVAIGGCLGALSRYLIMLLYPDPILVNFIGCFLAGFFYKLYVDEKIFSLFEKNFFFIGFLGSFTTFSGFILDLIILFDEKHYLFLFWMFIVHFLGSLFLFFLGQKLGKKWEKKT